LLLLHLCHLSTPLHQIEEIGKTLESYGNETNPAINAIYTVILLQREGLLVGEKTLTKRRNLQVKMVDRW
jgi:hypothetical protein